jgi:IclR family transcriptional regulator, acetate operon repressor
MDVKTAARTLDVFEAFIGACRPLSLSDLARAIGAPVSSCFGLVKTLESRGYLYALASRRAFYPTRKVLENARRIAEHDPLVDIARPGLEALHRKTGETVLLARRAGERMVYVDVIESASRVRYTAQPGEFFPLHSSAIGKAILSEMPGDELRALLSGLKLARVTPRTITRKSAFLRELSVSRQRGWFCNEGENLIDVMALAVPLRIEGDVCAVSVAGPIDRVKARLDFHLKALAALRNQIQSTA